MLALSDASVRNTWKSHQKYLEKSSEIPGKVREFDDDWRMVTRKNVK